MITFIQFQERLIKTESKQGTYYEAPPDHIMSLHGELFEVACDARHDANLLDVAKLCQFVPKNIKKNWKLFKLVEV